VEPRHGSIEKGIKMKKTIFQILAKINKVVMPSMAKKDLTKLTNWQKAIVAYRYWVTTNALG
jgi:cytochrome c